MTSPTEMSLAEAQAPAAEEDTPKHNLPPQPTPFFGRKKELAEIAAKLADPNCRLLTILGAGGMGKTRLSIEAAAAQIDNFTEGVTYVELVPVSAEGSEARLNPLVAALAGALKISFHGGDTPERQLFTFLQRKEMLLVFDNFEHLLARAVFVSDLLNHAPDVKILVTSRERLNLQPEWLFALEGLSFQDGNSFSPEANDTEALHLFVQRAGQVKPSLNMDAERPGILRICRLVEGMPLGLELAAAWVFQLSCMEIADEIEAEIGFLTTQMRDVPARHRSLRAVFDYSWDKLTAKEQDVLQKLSVFRGGFERNAAKAVANASLPLLASLIGKSLVAVGENGRYAIHELLRQFAAAKLVNSTGLDQDTQAQHARYYLAFLREQEPRVKGPEGLNALSAMVRDIDNIRHAIRWAGSHQPNLFARGIADSLHWLFSLKGWFVEGETTFGMIVDRLMPDCVQQSAAPKGSIPPNCLNLAVFLCRLGWTQFWLGRLQANEETTKIVLKVLPPTEDPIVKATIGRSMMLLAGPRFRRGDYAAALKLQQNADTLFEEGEDIEGRVENYIYMINVYFLTGDFDQAEQCLASGRQLSNQLGEQFFSRSFSNELGKLETIRGNWLRRKLIFGKVWCSSKRREISGSSPLCGGNGAMWPACKATLIWPGPITSAALPSLKT